MGTTPCLRTTLSSAYGMTLAQNAIRGRLEQLTNELVAEEGTSEELKAAA